jgi:probable O-glycosylation ligase (exosortase A-associated)
VLWLLLLLWMTVTSLFAINRGDLILERWIFVFKIQLMLAISLMLVTEQRQFKWLVWVVTLSVAFFGVKGGIFTITSGGGSRVWGPSGGLLQGNNELAIGLVMLVPFLYWMRETIPNQWARRGLLAAMALCVVSILGSQSRGALLAVLAMLFVLALKSRHKVLATLLLAVGLAVAVTWMPDTWTKRMDTIQSYEEDRSAMSRVYTWTTLWNAAVDRPLVGVGFRADSGRVFERYAPRGEQWDRFTGAVLVAHSIYFQMLGEHGFVGLFLFVALWLAVWVLAGRTGRRAEALPDLAPWLPLLMRMTQVSMVGFMVGGAFLSLAYLDLAYYLMGYVLLGMSFVREATAR